MMADVNKLLGSHTPVKRVPRVTRYSTTLDSTRRYLTDAPTPAKLAGYLKDADDGDVAAMIELNEEMEAKDSHLQGVASRRREAITALDWEILPETRTEDKKRAQEAADRVFDELTKLKTWESTLIHLSKAIGPGIAVTELCWSRGRLVGTVDVPGHRLMTIPWEDQKLRIETDQEMTNGAPVYGIGFIQHVPDLRAGFPIKVTITRAQVLLWLIKHFGVADWATFSEQYGSPWRVAILKDGADPEVIDSAEMMMKNMASDTYGVFTEAVDFKFLEAARNSQPYEGMIDWVERKQSILYLGQTLTTEQGSVGSLALGQVHDNVRASISLSDIKAEGSTIDNQVIAPMVKFWKPRENYPLPHFKRKIVEDKNLEERNVRMNEIRLGKELGLVMDKDFLHETLNIPQPMGEQKQTV